ncbi:hypothetical protein [Umezakia ovalisporum]|jgi:hypothetical protein|uniref:Uncharacterized protein n=2 Tax=Umezakia ovalisporum TaxID=75695 RepID=A0AA43H002_9CYAN|nr:hypothetical protein [Umezakia ovalisporum]MBI1240743.1 hypothetical protein [Nostoc sp. RI_552]MDH6056908.1 hypothetical protein [Umezakia ovalisporum FSS-43]MDH6064382.1 hypothetical protein [Umezakia ovalisporum FSS-62]MDH6067996.1 hypothetical protein [Umezakia ovalisporum APH033B]MDH6070948.1 hypothetical protein [Umezakia ovalisporum CobakiLakeA]
MPEQRTSNLTKKYVCAGNITSSKPTKATSTAVSHQSQLMAGLGHLLSGISALSAGLLTV